MESRKGIQMKPIRRIVIATDLSSGSNNAVERAVRLARAHGACIDLVHAFDASALQALRDVFDLRRLAGEPSAEEAARARYSAFAESLAARSGLVVEKHFGVGAPAAVIQSHVSTTRAALLVIARRSNPDAPGVSRTLKHSLHRMLCPVLVVRQDSAHEYERVLIAMDLQELSLRALEVALQMFPGAQHRMVYVIDPAWEHELWLGQHDRPRFHQVLQALRDKVQRQLDTLAQDLRKRYSTQMPIETEVVEAAPVSGIVDVAAKWGAHCVVVGRHAQGPIAEALVGSTALDTIQHVAQDVLVVP